MFGNSTWANPQQNQQQQQQGTPAFGQQPSAFGSGGTTGFSGFGQNQQQQPPAVNPMFGGATTQPATTGTSGFGSFGGTSASFGQPKPPGFGGFGSGTTGGTSAFGTGGSTFGQNTGTTSAFGQPSGSTTTFGGTSTGLFGPKPAAPTTPFGSTSTGAPAASGDAVAPVTTGSSNPPYQVYSEKDSNAPGNIMLNYQSISCMPAYRGTSFEELRVQDYLQGRRTAGQFGQSATFGLQPSQSTTTGFGQPATGTSGFSGFGQTTQQPSQPSTGFSFGGQQPSTSQPSAFGSGTGTGTSAFGSFGQNQQQPQQQQQQPSTGLFGGTTSAFGQSQPQQQQQTGTTGFGAFGQNANQPKPFGTFGQTSGTTAFGTGTGTGFGQSSTQPSGQPSTGLFGQPANQNQGSSIFGSFAQNKPAFGQPISQPSTAGFSLFGQNQQQQQQPQQQQPNQQQQGQPSTGLFGGTSTGTNLFGQNTQQQQQPQQPQQQGQPGQPSTGLFGQSTSQPSTNLFGGGGTGTNLFGNANNQNKPAFGTGLFGTNQQTSTTGPTQPSTGLFGQPLGQTNQQNTTGTTGFGTSLFGQKPATTAFGQSTSQPANTGFGSSLFSTSSLGGTGGGLGQSTIGTGAQQPLTASVMQPVQENLPIFSLLNSSQPASLAPPPKKISNYFVDVPMRSPLGISTARLSSNGKLRGFGASQSAAGLTRNGGLSASLAASRGPSPLGLSRTVSKSLLGPESFRPTTPRLGSDAVSSPKKLVLNKKIDPSEVFGRSMAKADGLKVDFNPQISVAQREKEASSKPTQATAAPPQTSRKVSSTEKEKDISELQDGEYYVKPPLEVLRKLSNRELSSFEGLVVGRKGYGEVQFLEPVDLTTLPRLKDLLGKFVEIDNVEVVVYPETVMPEEDKPKQGEGLNVRSRIIMHNCWYRDKATGEPIKDEKNPQYTKQLKRLQNMPATYFESFDNETGTWTFTVDHF